MIFCLSVLYIDINLPHVCGEKFSFQRAKSIDHVITWPNAYQLFSEFPPLNYSKTKAPKSRDDIISQIQKLIVSQGF